MVGLCCWRLERVRLEHGRIEEGPRVLLSGRAIERRTLRCLSSLNASLVLRKEEVEEVVRLLRDEGRVRGGRRSSNHAEATERARPVFHP